MTTHFVAVYHEPYEGGSIVGVFDSFTAARAYLETEADTAEPDHEAQFAVIEEWDGPKHVATRERNTPLLWVERWRIPK